MYKNFFKRFFDFWISLIALICISPILLVITIWLHFANKGAGAFFFQERPGKNEKIFKVIKFKTMTDERDADGNLLPDEKRITKVGRFVRSTSIDELLQLINVLKGDMALIGKPIKGRIIATRPGHTINNKFARMMRKEIRKHEVQAPKYDPNQTPLMDVNQILRKLLK